MRGQDEVSELWIVSQICQTEVFVTTRVYVDTMFASFNQKFTFNSRKYDWLTTALDIGPP